jgi:hypothetical protein
MCRGFIFKTIFRAGMSDRQDTICLMAIHPQPQAMTAAATAVVIVAVVEMVVIVVAAAWYTLGLHSMYVA